MKEKGQVCEASGAPPNYGFEHLIGKVLVKARREGCRLNLSFGDNVDSGSGGMISIDTELNISPYSITPSLAINTKGGWMKGHGIEIITEKGGDTPALGNAKTEEE